MVAVQTQDLSFGYNGRRVVDTVSLSVSAGECVAILGPNGAGKTTLLKLISGVLGPLAGSVTLNGKGLKNLPRLELAHTLAVVPQEFAVPFEFTVQEIVELGRTAYIKRFAGLTEADRVAVERAIRLTDLTSLRSRVFNELSGGERRRAVLALALAQQPKILLLDEPTQQLDIARQADVLDLVTNLSRESGLTVIAAIHDLNLAARYFNRLVLLHGGSIVADGSPSSVLTSELLEKIYGRPVEVLMDRASFPIVLPKLHDSQ